MKVGVITYPGSNCDDDAVYTLQETCGWQTDRLWHKDTPSLSEYKLLVLPGGFSYGDYLRCGAMAALSPIMENVKAFADAGGYVLGICNGFQVLCEAGLLPGALAKNDSLRFVCKDVDLKVETNDSPWTNFLKAGDTLSLPIAHGDGRYIIEESDFAQMRGRHQILLTYQNNPNGSAFDVAGVCNEKKNVFGLMPHPERASDLRSRNGMGVWRSIQSVLEKA